MCSEINHGFDWKTHTAVIKIQLLVEILFLQQCSHSGSDLNAACFSMKLIRVDRATRLSNTFFTFISVQTNTKAIISATFSMDSFKFDNSCLDFTAKVLPMILLHPS